jgi:serine/threonine-protein kinase
LTLQAGQLFAGRYTIREEVGKGGMAHVYRAFDTRLHRDVALKIMAAHLGSDISFKRRFEREARIVARLNHSNIVTVYDSDSHDETLYIVMEYIEGRSLHAILKEHGAPGLGYAVSILEPLCEALDYAHHQGAIHRDVKPHNVMVASDGRVLLTDFGIAQPSDADTERLTQTGTFIGTLEYIAPEQFETSQRADARSDLYALGIVAFEIITGRVPFSGNTVQLIAAHTQKPPPPPSSINPDLPRQLDGIFVRALAKSPEARFQRGADFIHALRTLTTQYDFPLASRSELASLATAGGRVAEHTTIGLGVAPTPAAQLPPISPHDAARPGNNAPIAQQANQPPSPPSDPPPHALDPHPEPAQIEETESGTTARRNIVLLLVGALLIGVLVALPTLMSWIASAGGNTTPTPLMVFPTDTATATPIPTATPVPPAATPIPTATPVPPTDTPIPTATPVPPTDTPIPTATPVPPTATPIPTATPVPPTDTPIPTATPVPPTATPAITPTEPLTNTYPSPASEYPLPSEGVTQQTTQETATPPTQTESTQSLVFFSSTTPSPLIDQRRDCTKHPYIRSTPREEPFTAIPIYTWGAVPRETQASGLPHCKRDTRAPRSSPPNVNRYLQPPDLHITHRIEYNVLIIALLTSQGEKKPGS